MARRAPIRGLVQTAHVTPHKRELARSLRRTQTPAERRAWELLRNRRCLGLKFRRQQPIRGFVVDFYCAELRLAIEVDGGVHDEPGQAQYDVLRTAMLLEIGVVELRLPNEDVDAATLRRLLAPLHVPPSPAEGEGGQGGEVLAPGKGG